MRDVKHRAAYAAFAGGILTFYGITYAQDLPTAVSSDLLTNSSQTTPWQDCKGSDLIASSGGAAGFDAADLAAEGCAYRETPVVAGEDYTFTCGISSFKYSSITLAFQDENFIELATRTTEVFEDIEGGAYSVTLTAPANATSAAVGIYGLESSGFQDCTLLLDNPAAVPPQGTVSGSTWFDANGNSTRQTGEDFIGSVGVSLIVDGEAIDMQTSTPDATGFNFSGLDTGICYQLRFSITDPTLTFSPQGAVSQPDANGLTPEYCITDSNLNVRVHTGYITIPTPEPPADNTICGRVLQISDSGALTPLSGFKVNLFDVESGRVFVADTRSDGNGRYHFPDLPASRYRLLYEGKGGYMLRDTGTPLTETGSFHDGGFSPVLNLPADKNSTEGAGCTIWNANGVFYKEPEALPVTVARDDVIYSEFNQQIGGRVQDIELDILANDDICGTVESVDLTESSTDGSGEVIFNISSWDPVRQRVIVELNTFGGVLDFTYGVRSSCGSYDTARASVRFSNIDISNRVDPNFRCQYNDTTTLGWPTPWLLELASNTGQIHSPYESYQIYDRQGNLRETVTNADTLSTQYSIVRGIIENYATLYEPGAVVPVTRNGGPQQRINCPRTLPYSPIAIDTDKSGDVQKIMGTFAFDMDADGVDEELLDWFHPGEGILVSNYEGGKITGEHLLGDQGGLYQDGYEKLAGLDANKDGLIKGDELSALQIWTDGNSNAKVDDGELSTLASHRIVELPTTHMQYAARAVLDNGDTLIMRDLWFGAIVQQASR